MCCSVNRNSMKTMLLSSKLPNPEDTKGLFECWVPSHLPKQNLRSLLKPPGRLFDAEAVWNIVNHHVTTNLCRLQYMTTKYYEHNDYLIIATLHYNNEWIWMIWRDCLHSSVASFRSLLFFRATATLSEFSVHGARHANMRRAVRWGAPSTPSCHQPWHSPFTIKTLGLPSVRLPRQPSWDFL